MYQMGHLIPWQQLPYVMQPGQAGQKLLINLAAVLAVVQLARSVVPSSWERQAHDHWTSLWSEPRSQLTFPEYTGSTPDVNYARIQLYLSGLDTAPAYRTTVTQPKNTIVPVFTPEDGQDVTDLFENVTLHWTHQKAQPSKQGSSKAGTHSHWSAFDMADDGGTGALFQLALNSHDLSHRLIQRYLQHIATVSKQIHRRNSQLKIFDNSPAFSDEIFFEPTWSSQPFKHPSTFHTLALNAKTHTMVLNRLDSFKSDVEYYNETGKPHKMGILLFGPPGTGKTSFIAAVANYMHYDIYNLDLSSVKGDKALRDLANRISDQALIVMEDIDAVGLPSRDHKASGDLDTDRDGESDTDKPSKPAVTLAGMLSFTDGLRSACSSQHIFVFTSNHPEKLDSALIRPGRMDLHVELTYCTCEVIEQLCKSHLKVEQHPKMEEVRHLIAQGHKVTPAQVAGILHSHRHSPDIALSQLVDELSTCKTD